MENYNISFPLILLLIYRFIIFFYYNILYKKYSNVSTNIPWVNSSFILSMLIHVTSSTSSVVTLDKSSSPSHLNNYTSIISLNFFPFIVFRTLLKSICPFSGNNSTPTSSFASRIAPCKLFSPFRTEPPTHSNIEG